MGAVIGFAVGFVVGISATMIALIVLSDGKQRTRIDHERVGQK